MEREGALATAPASGWRADMGTLRAAAGDGIRCMKMCWPSMLALTAAPNVVLVGAWLPAYYYEWLPGPDPHGARRRLVPAVGYALAVFTVAERDPPHLSWQTGDRWTRTDPARHDWRAPEYDDFWLQRRRYAGSPESWFRERDEVVALVASLPARRTLDVACGTGFITQHLAGEVTGLDQSERMLAIARDRMPHAALIEGDGLALPFSDDAFERVFTSHFYGHLGEGERTRFLAEARRVAPELVVLDAALHGGVPRGVWQDGS